MNERLEEAKEIRALVKTGIRYDDRYAARNLGIIAEVLADLNVTLAMLVADKDVTK